MVLFVLLLLSKRCAIQTTVSEIVYKQNWQVWPLTTHKQAQFWMQLADHTNTHTHTYTHTYTMTLLSGNMHTCLGWGKIFPQVFVEFIPGQNGANIIHK